MVAKARKAFPATTLLVDSGNILFKKKSTGRLKDQDILSANAIMQIYKDMDYAAMAIGPLDLAAGLRTITDGLRLGIPWLSANMFTESGDRIVPPWIIYGGDTRIGITALSAATANTIDSVYFENYQSVLPGVIEELSPACDFIILLSNLSMDDNEQIANSFPEINLLISASERRGNVVPNLVNNTLITQTHTRGKYLGNFSANVSGVPVWQDAFTQFPSAVDQLAEKVNKHLAAETTSASSHHDHGEARLNRLKNRYVALEEIAKHNSHTIKEVGATVGATYSFRFRAVTKDRKKDHRILKIEQDTKRSIQALNRSAAAQKDPSVPTRVSTNSNGLAGSDSCRECHGKQYSLWQAHPHASAYPALVVKGEQHNLECLACHVTTGAATAEQLTRLVTTQLLTLPDNLLSVGCESCHGPALAHVQTGGNSSLPVVSGAICRTCHTTDMDPGFTADRGVEMVACPPL